MKNFPSVLIFGQPFNRKYGGGITLSNLYMNWDKDKLAVIATGHVMNGITNDICDTYYQLGSEEYRWKFPFSLVQRKFSSGLVAFDQSPIISGGRKGSDLRSFLVDKIFYPTLEWLGCYHSAVRIEFSDKLKDWLFEYKPEVLYIQASTLDTLLFAIELKKFLEIPSVFHMMDDWPSTIKKRGPFRKYWQKRIENVLKHLLDMTDLYLSISEAMSEEYKIRYGKTFRPFHNPIDLDRFSSKDKPITSHGKRFRILYLGRVGTANRQSLLRFASFISQYSHSDKSVEFDIYTNDNKELGVGKMMRYKGVNVFSAVSYDQVPNLMNSYDLLILPLDFTKSGLKFSRYSMPTKASEYMASGIPILIFAPYETAISRFFLKYQCGYCVNSPEKDSLEKAMNMLISDNDYRSLIVERAKKLAFQLFDGDRVRSDFQSLISQLAVSRWD